MNGLRDNRRLQAAMRSDRLPAVKMLTDFDYAFPPSIKREQLDSLHELGFLERRETTRTWWPGAVSNRITGSTGGRGRTDRTYSLSCV